MTIPKLEAFIYISPSQITRLVRDSSIISTSLHLFIGLNLHRFRLQHLLDTTLKVLRKREVLCNDAPGC